MYIYTQFYNDSQLVYYVLHKKQKAYIYYSFYTKFPCPCMAVNIQSIFLPTVPCTTLKLNHLEWKIFDMPFIPTL